jgi:hypothetical protein
MHRRKDKGKKGKGKQRRNKDQKTGNEEHVKL